MMNTGYTTKCICRTDTFLLPEKKRERKIHEMIRSISYITISFFYKHTDASHFLESYCIVLSANIYINSGCMQRTRTIMLKVFVFLGRLYIAVL